MTLQIFCSFLGNLCQCLAALQMSNLLLHLNLSVCVCVTHLPHGKAYPLERKALYQNTEVEGKNFKQVCEQHGYALNYIYCY